MLSIQILFQRGLNRTLLGLFLLITFLFLPSSAAAQRRVIGGVSAQSNAWPWIAALVEAGGDEYIDQFCGGTLIHSRWVLTAAHCVFDDYGRLAGPADIEVILGSTNLRQDSGERIGISRILVHPDFDNHYSNDADIALLELEADSNQESIEIFSGRSDLAGIDANVIGWGLTDFSLPSPSQLQQASVPIVSNEVCNDAYNSSSLYRDSPITPGMMCAGFLSGDRDTCFGDSGGPLMIRDQGKWKVAGITSWGEGCATPGFFGVYTRVSEYSNFIENHVPQPNPPVRIFFPYIVSDGFQQTEIVIINTGSDSLHGKLRLFKDSGKEITEEKRELYLAPFGRKSLMIGSEFSCASDIRYLIFETDTDHVSGYERVFSPGVQAMSLPAVSEINSGDLYLPIAVASPEWETKIHLLNTSSEAREIHFQFENGEDFFRTLPPHAHETFTLQMLFNGIPPAGLSSAVIENSPGVIGIYTLEVVGTEDQRQMIGFQLTDHLISEISCFHLESHPDWWTGLLVYNPWDTAAEIILTPFDNKGREFPTSTLQIPAKGRHVAFSENLNLPPDAAWIRAASSRPVTGFDMIGSGDGKVMDGNNFRSSFTSEGLFSRIERDGWNAVILWNSENRMNDVTLRAYDENGVLKGVEVLHLLPHQRYLANVAQIFDDDISNSTHIHFTAEGNLSAFQINGSADGNTMETLPALDVIAWRDMAEDDANGEDQLDVEPELSTAPAFPLPFLSLMN